jgi:hypothetical protein
MTQETPSIHRTLRWFVTWTAVTAAVKAYRVVRHWGSHTLESIGSQMGKRHTNRQPSTTKQFPGTADVRTMWSEYSNNLTGNRIRIHKNLAQSLIRLPPRIKHTVPGISLTWRHCCVIVTKLVDSTSKRRFEPESMDWRCHWTHVMFHVWGTLEDVSAVYCIVCHHE